MGDEVALADKVSASLLQKRVPKPSARLTDENNAERHTIIGIVHPHSPRPTAAVIEVEGDDDEDQEIRPPKRKKGSGKYILHDSAADTYHCTADDIFDNASEKDQDVYNSEGHLKDLAHIVEPSEKKTRLKETADIQAFFDDPRERCHPSKPDKQQRVHDCRLCKYYKWCQKEAFESKLPDDVTARKANIVEGYKTQGTLDGRVQMGNAVERVLPYSDDAFQAVTIQWLVETDQKMIQLASRAKGVIKISRRSTTRREIINLFHQYLRDLKRCLTVSSNIDGYFAVTAHWIEEKVSSAWTLEGTLIGFIFMVTCDNASPNLTMMREFARVINKEHHIDFDADQRRVGCLVHIINLATQAVIAVQSKSPHYDPHQPDVHLPDMNALVHDEVGLIRAISVKVRWSLTYMMLNRAYNMPLQHVEKFITEISHAAKDRATSAKLYSLLLSAEEWNRVKKFQRILQYFEAGLQSGLDKISKYYDKTGDNDVYVFSIILNPRIRFSFFERSWPKSLRDEAMLLIRRIVSHSLFRMLLATNEVMLVQGEETHAMPSRGASQTVIDPGQEWEKEFNKYVMLDDDIPETVSTVHCERAFSSAGITITKRRNWLKGDIVEALQALKCAYRKNLFFHDVGPSSFTEEELEAAEENYEPSRNDIDENLVLDLDSDVEDDDVDV
ncbi:uncharacterized protein LAESUDRAFT_662032 [Laetiporus sulphureus 93-53]|uniref:HAT C-terminal dimerisation domain-containing protein n=1 Tax=Laetiporus sulphureus 93-53 TaxID=1314785 RepID=A0A165C6N3_9APHY|nr:uncharacterized protein LAESUDRAFT_662032 [Laetiporus sulphureus 93-53]KZT02293.1 hypothetical protein LAESUDRAFT_662032 [Laetiporus sulphureus 93-53]